ncbi:hypothetical protein D3C72_1696490 [compost metagenome]
MGLNRQSFMPAARQSSRSLGKAWAVKPQTGSSWPRARRLRVSSKPSITGIWQSVMTRSKGWLPTARRASSPLLRTLTSCPRCLSCWRSRIWLAWLSSTTSIRSRGPGSRGGRGAVTCGRSGVARVRGSFISRRVPRPVSLSMPISPPIIWHRMRARFRPRPLPGYCSGECAR